MNPYFAIEALKNELHEFQKKAEDLLSSGIPVPEFIEMNIRSINDSIKVLEKAGGWTDGQ